MSNSEYIKEFKKIFEEMCYHKGLSRKSAWSDLMLMFSCDISNLTEIRENVKKERIKTFKRCADGLGGIEKPLKLLEIVARALTENPAQDFLGELYMNIGMGERGWGQFFTPYNVSYMMAMMNLDDVDAHIKENSYTSIADPCVGAGAMLVAAAQVIRDKGYDPAVNALMFGQDLDQTAINMAYVQLSLTGCAAVLVEGNSLTDPYTGNPLFIDEDKHVWYTPALYLKEWNGRRIEEIKKYKKKEEVA